MSPEQAMGLRDLDERSDLYSLGCVVYEMLSGRLPYAGDTPQALLTDRFRSVPRPLRTLREEVPPNVERAVERALATDPEARFPSAAAFARELQPAAKPTPRTPVAATPTIGSAQTIEGASSRRWAAVAAGVLAVVVTLAGAVLWRARAASAESDALGPIAVLPLAHSSPSVGGFLSGDHCARLLYDALGRWEGLPLTDAMRVRDVLQRRPDGAWTLTEIRDIAQELGARLVVWGEVVATGDDLDVRVTVYRVARSLTPLHVAKAFVSAEEIHGAPSRRWPTSWYEGSCQGSRRRSDQAREMWPRFAPTCGDRRRSTRGTWWRRSHSSLRPSRRTRDTPGPRSALRRWPPGVRVTTSIDGASGPRMRRPGPIA
jgi:hypothetical protein